MKKVSGCLLLLYLVLLFHCASDASRQLLAENYQVMNNEELLRYYYRLNDEIDRVERPSAPVDVGFGVGSFGRSGGVGVGAMTGVYGGGTADDLRKRRIDVRMEMKKRGMTLPEKEQRGDGNNG